MDRRLKAFCLGACLFATARSAEAAGPSLSVSLVPPSSVRVSWPSNFTFGSWQLMYATNLTPANWRSVPPARLLAGDARSVLLPITDLSGYFRLQQLGGGGGGECVFQATPPVIQAGNSSTLTWCPQAGTTISLSPGPGVVTGSSFPVSPTVTTVYSLTASNALGVVTDSAAVIVNPCGWLQAKNWDAKLYFSYYDAGSTPDFNFSIHHKVGLVDDITFHLTEQAGSTATDAHFFGFATGGQASIDDREDIKGGFQVFTTTEVGSGTPVLNVSYLNLHLTCTSYDFSYSVVLNTTETSSFGVTTSSDGAALGAMASRPLPANDAVISGSEYVPAQYPPLGAEYFTPDSDLGKAAFRAGVLPTVFGSEFGVLVQWEFTPIP